MAISDHIQRTISRVCFYSYNLRLNLRLVLIALIGMILRSTFEDHFKSIITWEFRKSRLLLSSGHASLRFQLKIFVSYLQQKSNRLNWAINGR